MVSNTKSGQTATCRWNTYDVVGPCVENPSANIRLEDGVVDTQTMSQPGGELRINGVGNYEGKRIDIKITQMDTSDTFDLNDGSLTNGGFAMVTNTKKMNADQWIDLHIEIVDEFDAPVVLPISYWSVFDLEGPVNTSPESVRLRKDQVDT
eukprot:UN24514